MVVCLNIVSAPGPGLVQNQNVRYSVMPDQGRFKIKMSGTQLCQTKARAARELDNLQHNSAPEHYSTRTFHHQHISAPVHFSTSTFQHQYISAPAYFSTFQHFSAHFIKVIIIIIIITYKTKPRVWTQVQTKNI